MPATFSRTARSLDADAFRRVMVGLILGTGLLGGWCAWFFFARVTRYEVSDTARLEVDAAVHPVDTTAAGRLLAMRLVLGREVEAGEVLAEIDAEPQRLAFAEERRRRAAHEGELAALREEIAVEERALIQAREASHVALDEARAQLREAEAVDHLAQQEAERAARLHASGIVSDLEHLRAKAEAERRQAAAKSLRLAVSRLAAEQETRETDRRAHIDRLERVAARLEGERATASATIERLEHEIEKRLIRAAVAGRIGEVATLEVGRVVNEGDRLGAIVPPGSVRVVAHFPPSAAVGRIRPGQPARVRLKGFPWTQYGSLAATVSGVASEAAAGRVRVELSVQPDSRSPLLVEHGLPGDVEVAVERVSPATLVLRAAGQLVARPITAERAPR